MSVANDRIEASGNHPATSTDTTKETEMCTTETTTTLPADPDALAAHLAESPPQSTALDELEFERLSLAGLVAAVVARERQLRHEHAGLLGALGSLTAFPGVERWVIEAEVCAALAWSGQYAQDMLGQADTLTRLFPQTLQLLADGRICPPQARALTDLTQGLDEDTAHAVQAKVLDRMPQQSYSATRQAINRAVVQADPDAATKRHKHALPRRKVQLIPEDAGMATLSFYLPADVAEMAWRTLTDMARHGRRKNPTDKRTLDQRRADLLPALLHATPTGTTPNIPAHVNVVASVETLLRLSHEPGHLDGYGPICAEQTRRIANAHAATWRFLLTATDGTPVDASPRTYTPHAAVKRLTQLKNTTCVFPHCTQPSGRCDIDHNQPFDKGGPTTVENLAPICRKHHLAKTFGQWNLQRDGDTIYWTSALTGRRYIKQGTRYLPAPITG